jgi:hypothetical protein
VSAARNILELQDRIGIGDIKVIADQRHSERRVEIRDKFGFGFGESVAVGIPQQDDLVRARDTSSGPTLHQHHSPALEVAIIVAPAARGIRFRDKDVAVWQRA